MDVSFILPLDVYPISDPGILLIDIREHDEWRRGHIPGSISVPVDKIKPGCLTERTLTGIHTIIFHCQDGMCTVNNKEKLLTTFESIETLLLFGGMNDWESSGLPVIYDRHQPLPLMRQVHITAGAFILICTLAGALLASEFYFVSAFVGGWLLFSGISGWCELAKLLASMPWNRNIK